MKSQQLRKLAPELDSLRLGSGWKIDELSKPQIIVESSYGYAKVSQSEKEKWGKMIERYLHTSKDLKAVFLLIDIRHDPSANDKMMYDWILNNGYEPIIIATKLDKLKRSQVQKNIKAIKEGLKLSKDGIIIPFSAETKQGRDEIWTLIDELTGLAATEEA